MKKDSRNDDFVEHLSRYIGETVTIFTTGGSSGQGFTGVILSVNHCFVRLITRIDPAPGGFGNGCFGRNLRNGGYYGNYYGNNGTSYTVGSVADIPVNHITSFVHGAD